MHDCLYFDWDSDEYDRVKQLLKDKYPDAEIVDASDAIKGKRISIKTESVDEFDYFRWLIAEKLPLNSLTFGLTSRLKPELIKPLLIEAGYEV